MNGVAVPASVAQVHPWKRLRVRIASGVAMGLLTLIAVFAILMAWAVQISTQAALMERQELARHTAEMADDLMDHTLHQMQALTSLVAWDQDQTFPARDQPQLFQLLHLMGTFESMVVTDASGGLRWSVGNPTEIEGLTRSAALNSALQTGGQSVSSGEAVAEHPPIAVVAAPLKNAASQVAGAVVGGLHLGHMGHEIIPLPRGASGLYAEIMNQEGRVLASSGGGDAPHFQEAHRALLWSAVSAGREGTAIHEVEGASGHVVAFAPFRHLPGGVFVEEPNDVALAVPRVFRRIGLFVGSVALLLFSLGAWWHASRLTRPLEELTIAAQAIGGGSFDQPIKVQGEDELGVLSRNFEEMRRRLQEFIAQRTRWQADLEQEVEFRTKQAHELLGKVISAQEEERKRVARELHDGAAQNLATLLVALDALRNVASPSDNGVRQPLLQRVEEEARSALQEVRHLILDLRPTALDDLGLLPTVRSYAESRLSPLRIKLAMSTVGQERRLDSALETALFRIVQEAINNVAKHAAASRVNIAFSFAEDRVGTVVEDDGKGFDVAAASEGQSGGAGLQGMRERAGLIKGSLSIASTPGGGTHITVIVPAHKELHG